jgi:hypothetical protein
MSLFRLTRILSVGSTSASASPELSEPPVTGPEAGPNTPPASFSGSFSEEPPASSENSAKTVRLEHVAAASCGDHRFLAAVASNNTLVLRHAKLQSRAERVNRRRIELQEQSGDAKNGALGEASEELDREMRVQAAELSLCEGKPVVRVLLWLTERPQKR